MKLNKIFTFATLVAAMILTVSCNDTAADYEGPGAWDANENYADVYFQTTSRTEMVDPADATITTIELYRRNVSSAITVPLTILTNTDDAFTVGNAEFAAGDSVTTVTIDYSKAGIGSAYTLELAVEGADYVSSYSTNTVYTYTVTRVKWNLIGKGTFAENFWYEGENEVEIYQRDDAPYYFRIMNPFNDMTIYDGVDDSDGSQSEYVEINILQKGETFRDVKITASDLVYFTPMNTGYFHSNYGNYVYLYHPSAFTNFQTEESWSHNKVIEWQEDGLPGRIQLAPYYYIPGVGGWNYTTYDDIVTIDFPGYEAAYVASIEDYDWEPVFTGEYVSAQLKTTKAGVTLYKGVPKEDVEKANEGCFERFESAYGGTPYYIESPYANGKNLVFVVKNGRISAFTEDEDHDYEYQETGLTALGKSVYANILSSSLFTDDEITLDIQFQTIPDAKTGEYINYGTSTETLRNITWSKIGTGVFAENFWYEGSNEVEIYQRDDAPYYFRIMNPFNDMTIYDGVDDSDGSQSEYVEINILQKGETFRDVKITASDLVYFTPMNTGYFHSSYGDYVYLYHPSAFTNFQTEESWAYNKVIEWQENGLPGRIQLAPYYYIPGVGGWNYTTYDDVVTIDFPGYEAASAIARSAKVKSNKKVSSSLKVNKNQYSIFSKGTKAYAKSKKDLKSPSNAPLLVK